MNIYGIIILTAFGIEFILNLIADIMNLKNLNESLPEEFKDIHDEESYKKSQLYSKTKIKFEIITSAFSLAVILIFWFAKGFVFVNNFVAASADSIIMRGLLFFAIILLAQTIITIPFRIYSIFVIEEKFGFNKMTSAVFWKDMLKSFALAIVIGGPVLALILYIFITFGSVAWLLGWTAALLFGMFLTYISPRFIMPLFNKFVPLNDGDLKSRILELSAKVHFPLKDVFVIDGSKRSAKSNAFFTGFGKNKRIALYDTLIQSHTEDELIGVLAHEIGHYKKKHIIKGMIISALHLGILFFLLNQFIYNRGLYEAFFMDTTPLYAGILFFSLLYSPVELFLSVAMNLYSRKNEFEADEFAVENTHPGFLISALKKLSKNNLSNLTPHPFYVFLNYSHPPLLQRIKAMKQKEF